MKSGYKYQNNVNSITVTQSMIDQINHATEYPTLQNFGNSLK